METPKTMVGPSYTCFVEHLVATNDTMATIIKTTYLQKKDYQNNVLVGHREYSSANQKKNFCRRLWLVSAKTFSG
jgi:hypothetical protein